ncbi:hypothetical protein [Litoribrevibacter albus]|uniref:Uncharacterized protein n=1 Tax=Litoribrevibacter albus TaxID=1473156 RepID=A0AA37S9W2_9GAMM|nr:hypothetical protein [Litoribrevibacter albus]GLQ31118.1 hypothetical protein GCM10007876_15970 [Litoribrevibacter albus]
MADEGKEKEELTEEQQIQLLQKKNNSLKMVVTVLSGLSFILLLGVGTLAYLLSDQPEVEFATTTQTDELTNTLALQQANIEKLTAQLLLLEQQRVSSSGIPREAAIESQRDFLRLVHIMQNSMRDESRMIKGARSWYEHYNQLLNAIRQKGKDRLRELGSSEPNMSKSSPSKADNNDEFGDELF